MHLLDRLSNTRLRFSESAKAHIEEMRSIQTRLQSIGMALDKEFHVLYLLRSLPDEYSGLVVTLENASVELSLEDINARILREESRLKGADLNPGGSPAGQAYFGKGKKPFTVATATGRGTRLISAGSEELNKGRSRMGAVEAAVEATAEAAAENRPQGKSQRGIRKAAVMF